MANKFSLQPLLDAKDERVQYVNLDAKFLVELATEMDGEDEPDEHSVRLRVIAQRLEHLDEQVRNFGSNDTYQAGIIEGKRRYLLRSNLPLQAVELSPDLRKAVLNSSVPVKKIPSGKPRPELKPSVLAVAGIKLNLSFGKKD